MRYLLIITMLLLTSFSLKAEEDVLDLIAQEVCKDIEQMDFKTMTAEEAKEKFGISIIMKASKYKDLLKEKYKLDLSKMDATMGERLGELVAERIAVACPETFLAMAIHFSGGEEGESGDEGEDIYEMDCKITDIKKSDFYQFTVRDTEGNSFDFVWLWEFDNSEYLLNDEDEIKDRLITITYTMEEIYNPETNKYRKICFPWNIQVVK